MNSFSVAFEAAKAGKTISRSGWNGKGLRVQVQFPDEGSKNTIPYCFILYPNGDRGPWVPSNFDLFASDWLIMD